mmetsp:Transcript_45616/g.116704  ORF Transcript_45616/g.116704 Transcript_45616/m.116704 type:complete len:835 (-) Transcript_45616:303-2807(-)|eukprot:jgi/Tetstr1/461841/TSEL_006920.t1
MAPLEDEVLPCPHFEGSEKRIEIDFCSRPADAAQLGLRVLPRAALDEVLALAECTIVSVRSNPYFDAYVLSESSLFVYPLKVILKTCGTTKLLNGVPKLLEHARKVGMHAVRVKYSRADYLFPDAQPGEHKYFRDEARFLDQHFGHLGLEGGRALVLGDPLRGLQWHVYLAGADVPATRPTQTLEVCMTGLDRAKAAQFFRDDKFVSVEDTTRDSGIRALAPYADLDAYVFEPCGYSLNGLEGPGYLTIHITPEEACSYASVEFCGFPAGSYCPGDLVARVAAVFEPKAMSVLMSTDLAVCGDSWDARLGLPMEFSECHRATQEQHIGGHMTYLAGNRLAKDVWAPGQPSSPSGPLCRNFSFSLRSSSSSLSTFASVSAGDSADSPVSDGSPACPLASGEAGAALVAKLTDVAGGSVEMAGVLAALGAVPVASPGLPCLRKQAEAIVRHSDPLELDFFYLYDLGVVARLYRAWSAAMPRVHPHYAVKCNHNPGLLSALAACGAGFDCASRGEVDLVLGLGVVPDRIVFANCCKLPRDIRHAAARGVSVSVFDSASELIKTAEHSPDTRLLLRIRADDPEARCGLGNKYGVETMEDAAALLDQAASLGLSVVGVAFHVGSGSKNPASFAEAIERSRIVFDIAAARGFDMTILDIGGGMNAELRDDGTVDMLGVPDAVNAALDVHFPDGCGVSVIAEPGRFFAEHAALMATAVMGHRERAAPTDAPGAPLRDYYVTDGLYGSFNCVLYDHAEPTCETLRSPLLPTPGPEDSALARGCVFGPTCDGLDAVLPDTELPRLRNGDWLLFPRMGAYTIAGATDFNGINVTHIPTYFVYSN